MKPAWQAKATVHRAGGQQGDPAPYSGAESFTFVRLWLRDPDGIEGTGVTGRFLAHEVAHFLSRVLPDALENPGLDPVAALAKAHNPRGMGGVAVAALSALEIALTDIKAKRAGLSVAALFGGKRRAAPVHVTCGFPDLDIPELVRACVREVEAGADGVKVLIAAPGFDVAQDVARLSAVRAAIGSATQLIADANCRMDTPTATDLAQKVRDLDLAWLEEPIIGNDSSGLADLARTRVPLGAGQMEQSAERFTALSQAGVAVIQPNAVFAGGFQAAINVAQTAAQAGARIAPAGGWDIINVHWVCGGFETGAVELHRAQARIMRLLMPGGLTLKDGHLHVPDTPGLGLHPDEPALAACRVA
jgi:L-alanine-DL-glutamate epimerase-like enolase superfamily enzyme